MLILLEPPALLHILTLPLGSKGAPSLADCKVYFLAMLHVFGNCIFHPYLLFSRCFACVWKFSAIYVEYVLRILLCYRILIKMQTMMLCTATILRLKQ